MVMLPATNIASKTTYPHETNPKGWRGVAARWKEVDPLLRSDSDLSFNKSDKPKDVSQDSNLKGWESVAAKWSKVGWPRRPRWSQEFDKARKIFAKLRNQQALVLGATPEFRVWLRSYDAVVTLHEKSAVSIRAMDSIMKNQFSVLPGSEVIMPTDWENPYYEKNRYRVIMGDIVSGYLEAPGRFAFFLQKIHDTLSESGVFLLREFVNEPTDCPARSIPNVDLRRWTYVLTPDFAIEEKTFYEEKLAMNLSRIKDMEALATCANPPRTRLMLDYHEYDTMFEKAGFKTEVLVPPTISGVPHPALWALWK